MFRIFFSIDSFSEEAALSKVNELRTVLNGSDINELSPEKIKENLVPLPFGAIEEALSKQQIENTIKESRKMIESKDELSKALLELMGLLEQVVVEEKLRQFLLYEKLYEAGICLIDEYNICPLCGREWREGDFKRYLEDKRKEVEIAKEKQERIDEVSSIIKMKIDLLKNEIDVFVKAHKQFKLKALDGSELSRYLFALNSWSDAMIKPLESFENKQWPALSLQEVLENPFLEKEMLVPLEEILQDMGEKLSKQQTAWDNLTRMEVQWKVYQQALDEDKKSEKFEKEQNHHLIILKKLEILF